MAYLDSIRTKPPGFVRFCLEQDMLTVREMVWAIPDGHAVLERTLGDTTAMAWARNFFNMEEPITRNHGSTKNQALVREMWLHPDPEVRISALSGMLVRSRKKSGLSNDEEALLRSAAWDLTIGNGMTGASIEAATLITLWTMHDGARRIRGQGRHPLLNAVTSVEMTLRNVGIRLSPRSDIDLLLVAHPRACARVFMFACTHGTRSSSPDNSDAAFDCLRQWLPGSQSAIAIAKSMDLSYVETLQYVIDDLACDTEPEALPADVAP